MNSTKCCVVCWDVDETSDLIPLPCGEHLFCRDCLREAVQLAINDERHFPVRCADSCDPIPSEWIQRSLSETEEDGPLLHAFEDKVKEYSIPARFRTYCASKTCCATLGVSQYIDPEVSGDDTRVICPSCDAITCRMCRDLVEDEKEHVCNPQKVDSVVQDYVNTLPEEERRLRRQCWSCHSWIEKSGGCNHITCPCSAEFCLVCGRKWEPWQQGCPHGCPHMDDPIYDDEGYNQLGFHRETGLNRNGEPYDPAVDYEEEGDEDYDYDDDEPVYDENGFDQWGFDMYGLDVDGFDGTGFNVLGRYRQGFDMYGFDEEGFNRDGFNQLFRDRAGFFDDGCDIHGFDRDGLSLQNLEKAFYDEDGYDAFGFDVFGYTRAGFDFEGRDPDGYDVSGLDRWGYGRDGYDADGYNRRGLNHLRRDREGYSVQGFDAHHRDRSGALDANYYIGPDGNVHRKPDEGPSAEAMSCDHRTYFSNSGARCYVCKWMSDIFHMRCRDCDAVLCRNCAGIPVEWQRQAVRRQYLWPGDDSYGIAEMFQMAEEEFYDDSYGIWEMFAMADKDISE